MSVSGGQEYSLKFAVAVELLGHFRVVFIQFLRSHSIFSQLQMRNYEMSGFVCCGARDDCRQRSAHSARIDSRTVCGIAIFITNGAFHDATIFIYGGKRPRTEPRTEAENECYKQQGCSCGAKHTQFWHRFVDCCFQLDRSAQTQTRAGRFIHLAVTHLRYQS